MLEILPYSLDTVHWPSNRVFVCENRMLLYESFDTCLSTIKFNENMSISLHSTIYITSFIAPKTLAKSPKRGGQPTARIPLVTQFRICQSLRLVFLLVVAIPVPNRSLQIF